MPKTIVPVRMEGVRKSGRPWTRLTGEVLEYLKVKGMRNWHELAGDRKKSRSI